MKKILYFSLIIVLISFAMSINPIGIIFSNVASAQDTAREEYIIKKGDTLWDISDSKLLDNFLWPNLWRVNPQIKNPDLVYPGDRINIPTKEELMRLQAKPRVVTAPVITMEKPVISAPAKMSREYIVSKERLISSGWVSDEFPSIGKIFSSPSGQNMFGFGRNDLVYLETDESAEIGDRFFAIRSIKKVRHPKTGKSLGHQIRITGILEVIGMDGKDNDVPKAKITTAFEDIQTGNGLIPYSEIEAPVVPDTVRTPDIRGYIVESYMNSKMISEGDIVYLDKGQNDGLEVGDAFSALVLTPVERSTGKIQIISIKPRTSVALILTSEQDINVGDMWGKK